MERRVLLGSLLALALVVVGCSSRSPDMTGSRSSPAAPLASRFAFDAPSDGTQYSTAVAQARRSFPRLAANVYEYRDGLSPEYPASVGDFLADAHPLVVQMWSVEDTVAATVRDSTRPAQSDYLLLVEHEGRIVGSCDWMDEGAGYFSFYEEFTTLDVSAALRSLSESFGGRKVPIRIVHVPRGYWVVGGDGEQERARFVAHQGSFDDDPSRDRFYTSDEVIAYSRSHPTR